MMNIEVTRLGLTYTRVSKMYARNHYKHERIHMCPVNLRPGPPFSTDLRLWDTVPFDKAVDEFIWFNCNSGETGYYPAFYKVTEGERHEDHD